MSVCVGGQLAGEKEENLLIHCFKHREQASLDFPVMWTRPPQHCSFCEHVPYADHELSCPKSNNKGHETLIIHFGFLHIAHFVTMAYGIEVGMLHLSFLGRVSQEIRRKWGQDTSTQQKLFGLLLSARHSAEFLACQEGWEITSLPSWSVYIWISEVQRRFALVWHHYHPVYLQTHIQVPFPVHSCFIIFPRSQKTPVS